MSMTTQVKFLRKETIEQRARALLTAYSHAAGGAAGLPIPADEIFETHLKLSLDFDNLASRLGIDEVDVLGALWVDSREVFIDESLDPDEHPQMDGRLRFSVGHEIGHWDLHRPYLVNRGGQTGIFDVGASQPAVVCRTSERKAPIEWQADYFSSCLLMPRDLVIAAWEQRYGNLEPVIYEDVVEQGRQSRPIRLGMKSMTTNLRNVLEQIAEPHRFTFELVAGEFAPLFGVSNQAMRVRLEDLGLLLVDRPAERDLFEPV